MCNKFIYNVVCSVLLNVINDDNQSDADRCGCHTGSGGPVSVNKVEVFVLPAGCGSKYKVEGAVVLVCRLLCCCVAGVAADP